MQVSRHCSRCERSPVTWSTWSCSRPSRRSGIGRSPSRSRSTPAPRIISSSHASPRPSSARFTLGELASVDAAARIARTNHGAEIAYDALVIACGALPRPRLSGALTFRGPADSDAFRRLLDEARTGLVRSIAFTLPVLGVWPLPLYELALLTAHRARTTRQQRRPSLVTPEPSPMSIFGTPPATPFANCSPSEDRLYTGSYPIRHHDGDLEFVPDGAVAAERVVSLPRLEGLRILGIPQDDDGFIATDLSGRVRGLDERLRRRRHHRLPGQAGRNRDAAGRCRGHEAIAARAGAAGAGPTLRAGAARLLLTGDSPRYLRSELGGREGDTGTISHGAALVAARQDRRPPPRAVPR